MRLAAILVFHQYECRRHRNLAGEFPFFNQYYVLDHLKQKNGCSGGVQVNPTEVPHYLFLCTKRSWNPRNDPKTLLTQKNNYFYMPAYANPTVKKWIWAQQANVQFYRFWHHRPLKLITLIFSNYFLGP